MTTFNDTYDKATPDGTDDPSEADDRMREIKAAIQERLAVDHKFSLTGTEVSASDTGEHLKITFNVTIADPTQVASKAHLYMKDDELFYQDDTNTTKQLTNAGALNVTGAELLGILANNTYFTAVDNAGTGTVNLIKATTGDIPEILVGAVLSADTAPAVDAGIANKKYVDDVARFGVWNDRDADGSGDTVSVDTEYTAVTDGFVVARQIATGAGKLSLDMQSPTGTSRQIAAEETAGVTTGDTISATIPVRKGDTWKVVSTASGSNDTTTVYWMPLGTN